jgi:homoserine dehydrogenase
VIGTHQATEAALAATVSALESTDVVTAVSSVLRVEGL